MATLAQEAEDTVEEFRVMVLNVEKTLDDLNDELKQLQDRLDSILVKFVKTVGRCTLTHLSLFLAFLSKTPNCNPSFLLFLMLVLLLSYVSVVLVPICLVKPRICFTEYEARRIVEVSDGLEALIHKLRITFARFLKLCDRGWPDELRSKVQEVGHKVNRVICFGKSFRSCQLKTFKASSRVWVRKRMVILWGAFVLQVAASVLFWLLWRSDPLWSLREFCFK